MILSLQTIRKRGIISPWAERSPFLSQHYGLMTYGGGPAGYDLRVEFDLLGVGTLLELGPGAFQLASTIEHFTMPPDVMGIVHDKSTWARRGLACQNTVIEPGWSGYLTLEISNHGSGWISLERGAPICQVVFHQLDQTTELQYDGKYQNQGRGPQEAL